MTTDLRCPGCGSLVRPEAGWCSLCHEDLRSEEDRAAAVQAEEWAAEPVAPGQDPDWAAEFAALAAGPQDGPGVDPGHTADPGRQELAAEVPARGRHAKPAQTSAAPPEGSTSADSGATAADVAMWDADVVLAKAGIDVQGMIELLAANEPPPLGPLSGRLSTKGQRAAAILVAVVALTSAGLILMFLLGLFVH